jgi:capsular exopolysaccharide synthesis family protein
MAVTPLRGYLAMLRRRKWYVLVAVACAVGAALAFSFVQESRYEATAKVLLSQNPAGALSGGLTDGYQDPNRLAKTQLEIARVPALAERVIRKLGLHGVTPSEFLDNSSVTSRADADVLDFRVEAGRPEDARAWTTAYASEFTRYRRELETEAYRRAELDVRRRLAQLEATGEGDSSLYETMLERAEQLRTLRTVGATNAVLLREAGDATQVQPRPGRNALLAGLLGLLLGLVAVGAAEALDTRVRSGEEIGERLDVPMLGRIPVSALRARKDARPIVMLSAPAGAEAESFRMLRANLDFVLRDSDCRTIMVTSTVEVEGKSTTLANLAVAHALAGRHVIAVDLDLRRPSLDRLFEIGAEPGVCDVVSGAVPLHAALASVPVHAAGARNGQAAQAGTLEVLTAGTLPSDPGELVGDPRVDDLLRTLRVRADLVLVDTPPLLTVSDAVTVSGAVDGILLVVRSDVARTDELREFRRALSSTRAPKLGFVLTGGVTDSLTGSYYTREARVE